MLIVVVSPAGSSPTRPADPPPSPPSPASLPLPSARRSPGARTWRLSIPVVVFALLAVAVHRIEPAGAGPFYTAPDPLPAGEHGTIVRREPVSPAPAGARAWRVLYLSTALDGTAAAVSGVVLVPDEPAPPGGRPVVAWAHPTTGVASRCAPSLRPGAGVADVPGVTALLAAGYIVTVTDYAGLGTRGPHPYLVGDSEATAVLDSVRAARALPEAQASNRFVVWGHSQGGQAALFTGQRAGRYTPDLDLVGVAAAAPASDLTKLFQHDIGGVAGNVLASLALVSWAEIYGADGLHLDQVIEPLAVPTARLVADHCVETRAQLAVDLPNAEVLKVRFLRQRPWQVPGWDARLADNTPGSDTVTAPVLVTQGSADTIVWPGVTAEWVAERCGHGMTVDQRTYPGVTHTDIARVSAADTVEWIGDRFADRPARSTCAPPG